MSGGIALQLALLEVARRLRQGRENIQRGRFSAQRDLRTYGEHYLDGKLAGLDLALATLDQVQRELTAEAERLQREATGQGFTKAKHR